MGIFGGTAKAPEPVEPQEPAVLPEEEERAVPEPVMDTIIAQGITITGGLSGQGAARVEGTVRGEVSLEGTLVVAAAGRIKGPVVADIIRVAGCIEGTVTARESLHLEPTGTIEGDVTTATFALDPGGILNGRTTMLKPPPAPAEEEPAFAPAVLDESELDDAEVEVPVWGGSK